MRTAHSAASSAICLLGTALFMIALCPQGAAAEERPRQIFVHRVWRNSQALGDLLVRIAVALSHQQDSPIERRHLGQDGFKLLDARSALEQPGEGAAVAIGGFRYGGLEFNGRGLGSLPQSQLAGEIAGDSKEIG